MALAGWSDADMAGLREMYAWYKKTQHQRTPRSQPKWPDAHSGYTYIAKTSVDGIPALGLLTGTGPDASPGSSDDCIIYRIIEGDDGPELIELDELNRKVYNLSTSDLSGDTYVPVTRDKFGSWLALPNAATSGIGGYIMTGGSASIPNQTESIITGYSAASAQFGTTGSMTPNIATGRITFGVRGLYLVGGGATFHSSLGEFPYVEISITENGAVTWLGLTRDTLIDRTGLRTTVFKGFDVDDYIELGVYVDGGVTGGSIDVPSGFDQTGRGAPGADLWAVLLRQL